MDLKRAIHDRIVEDREPTICLGIKEPSEFQRYDRPGCCSTPWRLRPGETLATASTMPGRGSTREGRER